MTATIGDDRLTRAEAAYAHLASFAKGDQVVVTGRGYSLEGVVTTTQRCGPVVGDLDYLSAAYLIVTGPGTFPDGHGGWEQRPVECVITVDKMLSDRLFTVATRADAAAGNWVYFDDTNCAIRNPEGPLDNLRAECAAAGITAEPVAVMDAEGERLAREERWT